ncbi:pentapeptide MXKDX repeat protein [Rhizobium sp. 22-785-1]
MTIRSFTVAIGAVILGLSFAAGIAEAQSSDAMKKTDTMKMDTMKKDTIKTDSMKMAGNKTDCMHKAGMEKDSMKKSNMMKKCDAMK